MAPPPPQAEFETDRQSAALYQSILDLIILGPDRSQPKPSPRTPTWPATRTAHSGMAGSGPVFLDPRAKRPHRHLPPVTLRPVCAAAATHHGADSAARRRDHEAGGEPRAREEDVGARELPEPPGAGYPRGRCVRALPPSPGLARNAARPDRSVPEPVVRRHLDAVRRLVDGGELEREGFEPVHILHDPAEVEALEIRRRSAT